MVKTKVIVHFYLGNNMFPKYLKNLGQNVGDPKFIQEVLKTLSKSPKHFKRS